MLNVTESNKQQQDKIYNKYIKYLVFGLSYSHDSEDSMGFVTCYTIGGKRIQWQYRDWPHGVTGETIGSCFMELMINDDTRYDISYPEGDLKKRLDKLAIRVRNRFMAGGQL